MNSPAEAANSKQNKYTIFKCTKNKNGQSQTQEVTLFLIQTSLSQASKSQLPEEWTNSQDFFKKRK